MPFVENLDFLNANSVRKYPIHEGCSATSDDGVFIIPDDFLLDFVASISSDVSLNLYISKLHNFSEVIVLEISETKDNLLVGTFTIPVKTHQEYSTYFLAPSSIFPAAVGKLTVGKLDTIKTKLIGTFSFSSSATLFESRCVVPTLGTFNRLRVVDEKGNIFALTGDVVLRACNNLRFRVEGSRVILDAGEGLGLNKDCDNTAPCIRTINNVFPDETGNFTLIGLDCAEFAKNSNPPGLTLNDTCCKPCMGCDEINELTNRAMQLESDLLRLRDNIHKLDLLVAEFAQLVNFSCEC